MQSDNANKEMESLLVGDRTFTPRSCTTSTNSPGNIIKAALAGRFLTLLLLATWTAAIFLASSMFQSIKSVAEESVYPAPGEPYSYVALCTSVKDQSTDLPEWLRHHYHHLGIRSFYITDDGSVPPLSSFKDYGIPQESITFNYYAPGDQIRPDNMQLHLYSECHRMYGRRHGWIGHIDVDEFLEMTATPKISLSAFLRGFEEYGALGVSWLMANSNGHLTRPMAGVRKSFTSCIWDSPDDNGHTSDNRHVKSIVNTRYFDSPVSPHNFKTNSSTVTVGEKQDYIDFAFRYPVTRESIGLVHYAVKSRGEFEEKVDRGNGMGSPKSMAWFDYVENLPTQACNNLADYSP